MSSDKIIDRINKLRRLAESTNVNEAAQAAAEAQRLMSAYQSGVRAGAGVSLGGSRGRLASSPRQIGGAS